MQNPEANNFRIFIYMKQLKIAISTPDRAIIIPMEYDNEKDEIIIDELQVEPVPEKDMDISTDLAFFIAQKILNSFKEE